MFGFNSSDVLGKVTIFYRPSSFGEHIRSENVHTSVYRVGYFCTRTAVLMNEIYVCLYVSVPYSIIITTNVS